MTSLLHSFFNLLFPNLCVVCGETLLQGEEQICLKCCSDIPKTNFHLVRNNPAEKLFWGKVPVEYATAYFFFRKGSQFQKLLHLLKYKNNSEIGRVLGKFAGAELRESAEFRSIDIIVPVPLHEKKILKRGYNQSELIAEGLATILDKPLVTDVLVRSIANPTQTKKSVYERYENTKNVFQVTKTEKMNHKHILLVDDVLTTGSTLEGCIQALTKIEGLKVSVFVLAMATE